MHRFAVSLILSFLQLPLSPFFPRNFITESDENQKKLPARFFLPRIVVNNRKISDVRLSSGEKERGRDIECGREGMRVISRLAVADTGQKAARTTRRAATRIVDFVESIDVRIQAVIRLQVLTIIGCAYN